MKPLHTAYSALKKAAEAVLPTSAVAGIRRARMRRFDLNLVVGRESRWGRFVRRRILRLYYPPGMVSRQSGLERLTTTRLLHRKPRLFHFEIHITDHCNLNCQGCGHFSNLSKPSFLTLEQFDRDVAAMAKLFEVEQVFLLGGEPLLHPLISEFVRSARTLLPTTRLYLMTNGLLVTKMDESFWAALADTDTILLCDLYPIGLPKEEIDELGARHHVRVEWTDPRTDFFKIPIDVTGRQNAADSFRRCNGINNCPMLRDGKLYPCAFAAYADILAEKFSLEGLENHPGDSLDLLGDVDSLAAMNFLLRPVPWCAHCDFDSFHTFPWARSQRRLEEWVGADECAPSRGNRMNAAELEHRGHGMKGAGG